MPSPLPSFPLPTEAIQKLNRSFRKVGLFGGIYNNHYALRSAAEMARGSGCEALFCLGDLGGFGPHPDKVFPLLKEFNIQCIQGNYEESLARRLPDCGCGYTHPKDNHYAALSYDYTDKNLSDENRALLATFPKQLQFQLGSLTVHLCHGSPRRINEFLWETTTSDGFVRSLLRDLNCQILCCTHTGLPWSRQVQENGWMVNVGVLGRPANDGRRQVWYTELTSGEAAPEIKFIPVEYDWQSLAAEMREEGLPELFVETVETGYWTTCLEILPGKERSRGKY